MQNAPTVKLGIVAVSRDCFPKDLSRERRSAVVAECKKLGFSVFECPQIVEDEPDVPKALSQLKDAGVNAMVVFLGNFGPEGPETMLAQRFEGPVMVVGAGEENSGDALMGNRGDAYCGMLNASFNLGLRKVKAYIPEYPVGTPDAVAAMIEEFIPIARVYVGVKKLKIFSFGPRPFNFIACNAPIKQLFDLGVEIQENSELDLYDAYLKHADDPRIAQVKCEMENELEGHNNFPAVMDKLAQYEITLIDWLENNLGICEYGVFANKCWPAFQTMFGFVPCYVNSRLAAKGYPVACETDSYGALSEYILYLATGMTPTLLDVNNTVPADMYKKNHRTIGSLTNEELFMGFHCGNTSMCNLKPKTGALKYQLIMKRLIEPNSEPNVSRGTLEGQLKPGDVTMFRIQGAAEGHISSYVAQGQILDIDPCSFGGIGVMAIPEMGRFYRHVLIEKHFPHHAGIGFAHVGKTLFEVLKLLSVEDINYNQPASLPYKTENPFK
ncbi:MAG TPA: fucose isomerase [Oscillospiraceae bacterium]|nr:fucose isomerase [Oscillospiraceae bacterium]HPF56311.1 fucose isomerase [Clostridiales bacterium]HPK34234.1 fucose isomerase [Oscillospiraceae bacterium]HPR74863.1 fucose isomerase [Oscillospiraceae bacterium]